MRGLAIVALAILACGTPAVTGRAAASASPRPAASQRTPTPVASVPRGHAPSLSFASTDCAAAQAAQFDFWLGTWDVVWDSPSGPLKGTNTVTKQGCVIVEHFDARLAGVAGYIGNSAAAWVPSLGKW